MVEQTYDLKKVWLKVFQCNHFDIIQSKSVY